MKKLNNNDLKKVDGGAKTRTTTKKRSHTNRSPVHSSKKRT